MMDMASGLGLTGSAAAIIKNYVRFFEKHARKCKRVLIKSRKQEKRQPARRVAFFFWGRL